MKDTLNLEALTLEDRRRSMKDFLLANLDAVNKSPTDDGLLAEDKRGRKYHLILLAKQSDFPVSFSKNNVGFDEDRRRLYTVRNAVRDKIVASNQEGIIPGFVFLCGSVDYHAMTGPPVRSVNGDHFRKQALRVGMNKHPKFDLRMLDQLELIVMQFYMHTDKTSKMARVPDATSNFRYLPELNYYNSKRGQIEVAFFADYSNPLEFVRGNCPACSQPNMPQYNHEECKSDPNYRRYVFARAEARYVKHMMLSRIRSGGNNDDPSRKTACVRLAPATLLPEVKILGLSQGQNYQIARIV